jgi:hypothetical protein
MVSYFKTQWWRLLLCIVCLGLAIFFALQPAADSSTIEGLNENLDNMFASASWLISSLIWGIISFVDYNDDRIKLLEAKAKKYDALAEKIDALQELLETESKYSNHLNQRIDSLVYEVKELKED